MKVTMEILVNSKGVRNGHHIQ